MQRDDARGRVLEWVEQGRIAPENLRAALEATAALPTQRDWRRFVDTLLLWMGTALVAAGILFFFAYNWQDLGRFAKLGLLQTLILATLAAVWRLGVDATGGKAALLAASVLLGGLLALIGQTYQTGADTFELFAAWAAMILPWTLVARFVPLWLLWLLLVNLAAGLYFGIRPGTLGLLLGPERLLWILFGLNGFALAAWECLAAWRIEWLRGRWAPRLIAMAAGGPATALAVMQAVAWRGADAAALAAWLAWMGATWWIYRHRVKDVFMLAGGVLSAIVVTATFLGRHTPDKPAALLMIGLIVIGLSAAGGWWLRTVAAEEDQ